MVVSAAIRKAFVQVLEEQPLLFDCFARASVVGLVRDRTTALAAACHRDN